MPRITKRDKESGKGKPKATAADPRKRSSGPPGAGKKSGFKVGPAHAPKDAYLGKGMSSVVSLSQLGDIH